MLFNILLVVILGSWILLSLFDQGSLVHLLLLLAAIVFVLKLMEQEWKRVK